MKTAARVVGAVFLFICAGCGDDPATPQSQLPLDVDWMLVGIGLRSSDLTFIPDTEGYGVRFETDRTISGTNACNSCEGMFATGSDASLTIAAQCTEAACGIPAPWLGYADVLGGVQSFRLVENHLVLRFTDRQGQAWEAVHSRRSSAR